MNNATLRLRGAADFLFTRSQPQLAGWRSRGAVLLSTPARGPDGLLPVHPLPAAASWCGIRAQRGFPRCGGSAPHHEACFGAGKAGTPASASLRGSLSIPLQPEGFSEMGVSMATEQDGAGNQGGCWAPWQGSLHCRSGVTAGQGWGYRGGERICSPRRRGGRCPEPPLLGLTLGPAPTARPPRPTACPGDAMPCHTALARPSGDGGPSLPSPACRHRYLRSPRASRPRPPAKVSHIKPDVPAT